MPDKPNGDATRHDVTRQDKKKVRTMWILFYTGVECGDVHYQDGKMGIEIRASKVRTMYNTLSDKSTYNQQVLLEAQDSRLQTPFRDLSRQGTAPHYEDTTTTDSPLVSHSTQLNLLYSTVGTTTLPQSLSHTTQRSGASHAHILHLDKLPSSPLHCPALRCLSGVRLRAHPPHVCIQHTSSVHQQQ